MMNAKDKPEFAIYSAARQAFLTCERETWEPWAKNAIGFATPREACLFIMMSGWVNTTRADVPDGAYVVTLT